MPAEKPSSEKSYQMPEVKVGDIVLWRLTPDRRRVPTPAIVTRVFERTVSLSAVPFDSPVFQTRDAVRHIDDPQHRQFATVLDESGVWSHKGD